MSDETTSSPVKSTSLELTARETTLLVSALVCSKSGGLQVDYDKLAEREGFAGVKVARASWSRLRRKLENMAEATDGEGTPKMTKRKETSDDGEDVTTPTPKKSKKTVATGKKGDKAAKMESEDEDDY